MKKPLLTPITHLQPKDNDNQQLNQTNTENNSVFKATDILGEQAKPAKSELELMIERAKVDLYVPLAPPPVCLEIIDTINYLSGYMHLSAAISKTDAATYSYVTRADFRPFGIINYHYNNGTTATRPTEDEFLIPVGFIYFDTTLGKSIVWNGTAWRNMDGTSL
jgi:hypothetical protein